MNNENCATIERHLYSFYRKAANRAGLTYKCFNEFSMVSGTPGNWPNYCFNLRAADEKLPTLLNFMVAEMQQKRIPPVIVIGNDVNQSIAHEILAQSGLKLVMEWAAMSVNLEGKNDFSIIPEFKIEKVSTPEELEIFINLVSTQLMRNRTLEARVFDKFLSDPEIIMYLAYIENKAVGTGLLYTKNEVAGLYMVSVNESFRNIGIGKTLTANMMNEAFEKSCKIAILHATAGGEHVYRKFGFQEFGRIITYLLPD